MESLLNRRAHPYRSEEPLRDFDDLCSDERASMKVLKYFIKRVLDSLEYIELCHQVGDFKKVTLKLSQDDLSNLSMLKFNQLLLGENSFILRRLLESSIEAMGETALKNPNMNATFQTNTRKANLLCQSFFTEKENRNFISESILESAAKEDNKFHKEEMLE